MTNHISHKEMSFTYVPEAILTQFTKSLDDIMTYKKGKEIHDPRDW